MTERPAKQSKMLERFTPPPALCAVPVGLSGTGATPGIPDGNLLMGVAVASFIGAGVWMFRKYGRPQTQGSRAGTPGLRPEPMPSPA
ncbi:MAG: hypothetical protein MSC31_17810 [Solirubrobacteraceae bacterium MAG38_C4-C5]|nr:hypothetical protein [Candidatus Siliceabacter maunaloa]